MIDALMYAVRDTVRGASIGYGAAECEIMDDGRPPPRCGSVFASVHGGREKSDRDNQLMENCEFKVTLTMRIVVPLDRVGDQMLYRNLVRQLIGEREGMRAKADQLRRLLHMNWMMLALANKNLCDWLSGEVYGFCEPARYTGATEPRLVGGEWFTADPDADDIGAVIELSFERARRMQPQTAAVGPFA